MRHTSSVLLISFLLSVLKAPSAHAGVVISEILWAGSTLGTADEWVELACVPEEEEEMACPQNMSGWTLSYLASNGQETPMVRFESGSIVGTGAFLIANYSADQSALLEEPDIVTPDVSLPNTKLKLWLRDADGLLIDEADDGVGSPFAGASPSWGAKASMERIDPFVSGAEPTNWRSTSATIGVDAGSLLLGTPGFIEPSWFPVSSSAFSTSSTASSSFESSSSSVSSESSESSGFSGSSISSLFSAASRPIIIPPVRFSEVLADPVGRDDDEWVEVVNAGSGDINIGGWTLSIGTKSFILPHAEGYVLWPGRHLALHKPLTGLELPNAGGTVKLLSGSLLVDEWTYVAFKEGVSATRTASAIVPLCTPTPDAPNIPVPPDVSIAVQSGETTGEAPLSLNVELRDADGPVSGLTCAADFGDGTVSSGCNPPTHRYEQAGTYTLKIQATDYCGVSTERTLQVRATQKPAPATSGSSSNEEDDDNDEEESAEACRPSSSSGIVLSELLPDPEGDDAQEWIELQNRGRTTAGLCGWKVEDESGASHVLKEQTIAAGGYFVLARSVSGLSLNNGGDVVRLRRPDGSIAQEVRYATATSGKSYADVRGAFVWTTPTPGTANIAPQTLSTSSSASSAGIVLQESGAVLEEESTPDASAWINASILLSEASPAGGKGKEWIELFNAAAEAASLAGWQLDDIVDGGSKPQMLGDIVIPSGGFLVLSGSTLTLSLNDTGDDLRLLTPDGEVREVMTLDAIKAGTSWSRTDDESACITAQPTPGEPNVCIAVTDKKALAKIKPTAKNPKKTTAKKTSVGVKTIYAQAQSGAEISVAEEALYDELRDAALAASVTSDGSASGGIGWKVAVSLLFLVLAASWGFFYQEQLVRLVKKWMGEKAA